MKRREREQRYGVRWFVGVSQWEVYVRGDMKPSYHADLNEAIEEYRKRSGGKGELNGRASKSLH